MECRCGLAMRKLSVRRSVCLSVTRVDCDKTEERSVQIFTPYERSFSLVFWEEWLVRATPSTWNFGSIGPRLSEMADFQPISAQSVPAQAWMSPPELQQLELALNFLATFLVVALLNNDRLLVATGLEFHLYRPAISSLTLPLCQPTYTTFRYQ